MAARSSDVPQLGAQNDDAVQYVSRVSDFDLPSVCVCVGGLVPPTPLPARKEKNLFCPNKSGLISSNIMGA